jgi:uncharacterized membrane protein YedE/YeeE
MRSFSHGSTPARAERQLDEYRRHYRQLRPLWVMAAAGLLVGFGTRLGGACTSGHGVCGVGTGAKDSIAATFIFVAVAMMTVLIYNRVVL